MCPPTGASGQQARLRGHQGRPLALEGPSPDRAVGIGARHTRWLRRSGHGSGARLRERPPDHRLRDPALGVRRHRRPLVRHGRRLRRVPGERARAGPRTRPRRVLRRHVRGPSRPVQLAVFGSWSTVSTPASSRRPPTRCRFDCSPRRRSPSGGSHDSTTPEWNTVDHRAERRPAGQVDSDTHVSDEETGEVACGGRARARSPVTHADVRPCRTAGGDVGERREAGSRRRCPADAAQAAHRFRDRTAEPPRVAGADATARSGARAFEGERSALVAAEPGLLALAPVGGHIRGLTGTPCGDVAVRRGQWSVPPGHRPRPPLYRRPSSSEEDLLGLAVGRHVVDGEHEASAWSGSAEGSGSGSAAAASANGRRRNPDARGRASSSSAAELRLDRDRTRFGHRHTTPGVGVVDDRGAAARDGPTRAWIAWGHAP